MKRLLLISFVLLLVTSPACMRLALEESDCELGVYIGCPSDASTKATVGDVPGSTQENAVHSIFVWIFDSESHNLIDTLSLSGSQLPTPGRVRRYEISVTKEFAIERPRVDVFAIANAESIGCTLTGTATWEQVNDAVFGGDYFGVSNPVRAVDPSLGLPMTGVGRGLEVQGEEPMLKIETIQLERIVSKLRFVFCKMANENSVQQDVIKVNKVTLNGYMIPVSQYLFLGDANDSYAIAPGGYDINQLVTYGPETLAANETPEKLTYANQDPASYETLLNNAVSEGTLTDWGVTYLRESDKTLTGYIDYEINGESKTKTFSMAAPGDFARNHNWTIYGYFLSGRNLQVSVRALPWDYSRWNINFSDDAVQASQIKIDDSTVELVETSPDHWDARMRPGIPAKFSVNITAPASGKLMARAIGDTYAFIVDPEIADINPDVNSGSIEFSVSRNPDAPGNLSDKSIILSFYVELGERDISADSEIFNGKVYRFVL